MSQGSVRLQLPDPEGLRDFPVEEELGRLAFLCLKQFTACLVSCLSTVQAGPQLSQWGAEGLDSRP